MVALTQNPPRLVRLVECHEVSSILGERPAKHPECRVLSHHQYHCMYHLIMNSADGNYLRVLQQNGESIVWVGKGECSRRADAAADMRLRLYFDELLAVL